MRDVESAVTVAHPDGAISACTNWRAAGAKSAVGAGRVSRFEPLDELRNVRVVGDVSSIEVFVNDGELTFSTRYYPKNYHVTVDAPSCDVRLWELNF